MRVVFVQKFVPHYRLPFFEGVRDELAARGIDFLLIYGPPDPDHGSKLKIEYPEWGVQVNTRMLSLAGRYLYWQGVYKYLKKGDMVVAEHAAKMLDNYWFYTACQLGRIRFGYFGHGENFQAKSEYALSRYLKKLTLTRVTRWFAYTEVSRQSLLRQGVEDNRISVVNNTLVNQVSDDIKQSTPKPGCFVYIGGIYLEKLIPLLLDAAKLVAAEYPAFELHIVGDGKHRYMADDAAKEHPWIKVHGPLYGDDKDRVIAEANAILMPGLVGLVAVDSFHYRRPVLTSDAGEHSPEIAYLENGHNCLIDEGDAVVDSRGESRSEVSPASFARLVKRYIDDPALQASLSDGCAESEAAYTMNNMVSRFCDGIELCFAPKA